MEDLGKYNLEDQKINQLVRYYQVPSKLGKEDALNIIFKKIDSKTERDFTVPQSNQRYIWISTLAAASVVILVVIYVLLAEVTNHNKFQQVQAFRLPDNSRVVLTSGSSLSYKKYFWNRNVKLTGEGYFEVEKGASFKVKSQQGMVEVLGTRFKVADHADHYIVECFEGKVSAKTDKNNQSQILTPGLSFENGIVKKETASASPLNYPEFAVFERNYSGAGIEKVMADFEQFFNITIDLSGVGQRQFSGTIRSGSPVTALAIVCESLQLSYNTIENNKFKVSK